MCFSRAKTFKTNVTVVWGAIARDHSLLNLPATNIFLPLLLKQSLLILDSHSECFECAYMMPVMWCWSACMTFLLTHTDIAVPRSIDYLKLKIFVQVYEQIHVLLQHAYMYGLKSMKIIVLLTMYTFIHLITIFD